MGCREDELKSLMQNSLRQISPEDILSLGYQVRMNIRHAHHAHEYPISESQHALIRKYL